MPLTVFDLLAMHNFVSDLPTVWLHRLAAAGRPAAGRPAAVEFDAAQVRAVIAKDAELGRELTDRLLGVVADRLCAARHRLVELYAYPGAAS